MGKQRKQVGQNEVFSPGHVSLARVLRRSLYKDLPHNTSVPGTLWALGRSSKKIR